MPEQDDQVEAFIAARAHRPGWAEIPERCRPCSITEGYRLQRAIHARLTSAGDRRVGWKVGSTAPAGQKVFDITEPVYAGLFESGRAVSLVEALSRPLAAPSIECEIAFVLRAPLAGPDFSDAKLADAIGRCTIGCEVIDNRYGDPMAIGVPSLVADDFFHAGFVTGPENRAWQSQELATAEAAIEIDGVRITGSAREVLDAFSSLRWLAKKLVAAAQPLQAGELVMTGSITTPMPVKLPARSVVMTITGFAPLTLP